MVIGIILLVLVLAVLCGTYLAYRTVFYSPNTGRDKLPSTNAPQYDPYRPRMAEVFKQLNERTFEWVTITSHDGLKLSGRYYHIKDGAPLDIGFHGYRSSPLTDFSGGTELSFGIGHNVLLVDQRSHGKSEGNTIAFGILERQDCLNWVKYALDRFGPDTKILLYGVSMGAATVLMASELELPDNVKGIIADCPYSSPSEIIKNVGAKMNLPTTLCYPFIVLAARLFGGFDLNAANAAKAVKSSKVPILIIHGEADNYVPCEMSKEISLTCPKLVQWHGFPGADHGLSYLHDTKRYWEVVQNFLKDIL